MHGFPEHCELWTYHYIMIYTLIVCPHYLSLSVADSHLVDVFSVPVEVVERERVVGDKARNNGNHNIVHTVLINFVIKTDI